MNFEIHLSNGEIIELSSIIETKLIDVVEKFTKNEFTFIGNRFISRNHIVEIKEVL